MAGETPMPADSERVLAAMRSGEWLRTQWIARVAFDLGAGPWELGYGARCLRVLRRLMARGQVEWRPASELRRGQVAGQEIAFEIPRWERRLLASVQEGSQ
jgi:hypothetical protein